MKLSILILFSCVFVSSWSSIVINESAIIALEYFYNATNGPNWHRASYPTQVLWNFGDTSDICSWEGICCTNIEGNMDGSVGCAAILAENKQLNISKLPEIIPIPSSVFGLCLQGFRLNGTIPDQFFNLTSLQHLALDGNLLRGPVPSAISHMPFLSWLTISANKLTGFIPSTMSSLINLMILSLSGNSLRGQQIPESICSLTKLAYLDLSLNNFHGIMPSNFTKLVNLNIIYLDRNHLYGPVPDIFGNNNLFDVDFHDNHFTGPFPAQMTGNSCRVLDLSRNYLTGTLPSSIGQMTSLRDVYLFNNSMQGTIATELGLLPNLTNLYLQNNLLYGTIPSEIMTLSLQILSIGNNNLVGTLPPEISNMQNLVSLWMNNNKLYGTLPKELALLTRLTELFVQFNSFTGQISNQFVEGMNLETIQLSGNHFSGPFPESLFKLRKLTNLIVVGACFSGSLPQQVCNATALKVLALNGLTSSSYCQYALLNNHYTPLNFMSGTIPSCLFQLSKLVKLELSGNGFNGQLALPTPQSSLQDLTLSYNRLSGSIPISLQQSTGIAILDLSFNRLSGDINSMGSFFSLYTIKTRRPATPHNLKLDVNQLSGNLPNEFWNSDCNLTVVNGNLFSCGSHGTFPHNDVGWLTNFCGAYNLDVALEFSASIIGVCILIAIVVLYLSQWKRDAASARYSADSAGGSSTGSHGISRQSLLMIAKDTATLFEFVLECISKSKTVPLWAKHFHVINSDNVLYEMPVTVSFLQFAMTIEWLTLATCLLTLIPVLLLQIMLKYVNDQQYSSHKNQYTFTPSLAYMKGYVPAGIIFALVIVLGSWLHRTIKVKYDLYARFRQASLGMHTPYVRKKIIVIIVMLIANVLLMGGANLFYLSYSLNYIPHWQASTVTGLYLEILLGFFKCLWNMFGLSYTLRKVKQFVKLDHPASFMPTALLASLMIINNIFIPMIFTMASDPNCFYFGFIAQLPSVEFAYTYRSDCDEQRGYNQPVECVQGSSLVEIVKFNPPFMYGYQCSSAVLNYYAPVFVAMFSFMIILSPFTCSVVPYLFSHVQDGWLRRILRFIQSPITQSKMQSVQDLDSNSIIIASDMITACLITSFTMLLTYGLAYPLLGVLIAVAISVDVSQQRYLIGRYLTYCNELYSAQHRSILRAKLEFACDGTAHALDKFKWVIVMTVALYYALYVLDMTGNNANVDWSRAQWLPIFLLLWPFVLGGMNLAHIYGSNLILTPLASLSLSLSRARDSHVSTQAHDNSDVSSSVPCASLAPAPATQVFFVQFNSPFADETHVIKL